MPPAPKPERRLWAGLLLPVLALGCGDAIAEVAATRGVGGATTTSVTATGGAGGAPPSATHCNNKIYQCGDLQDNDGDGLVDSADPDCLGPCDNTEDAYHAGLSGQNEAPCRMDCYFDGDSGHGTDGCFWSHRCDPNEVPPHFYPEPDQGDSCAYDPEATIPGTSLSCEELMEAQSERCLEACLPLTPNGCDCFGCCELPAGSKRYVWLGSEGDGSTLCTADQVDNPAVCHPCEPVPSCFNACDRCEQCIGEPAPPPDCDDPGEQCEDLQPCGPNQPACPAGSYCITGCCVTLPE